MPWQTATKRCAGPHHQGGELRLKGSRVLADHHPGAIDHRRQRCRPLLVLGFVLPHWRMRLQYRHPRPVKPPPVSAVLRARGTTKVSLRLPGCKSAHSTHLFRVTRLLEYPREYKVDLHSRGRTFDAVKLRTCRAGSPPSRCPCSLDTQKSLRAFPSFQTVE